MPNSVREGVRCRSHLPVANDQNRSNDTTRAGQAREVSHTRKVHNDVKTFRDVFPQAIMISLSFAVLLGVALVIHIFKRGSRASIASLPRPPLESFLLGNLRQFFQNQGGVADCEWIAKDGGLIRIKGILGEDVLFVSDPKAVQHIYHTYRIHVLRKELTRLIAGKVMTTNVNDGSFFPLSVPRKPAR
ncbi:hypothetical protein CPB85DRAFT_999512 [Mucidula mucida]|nr:hypothetical protein CPB85DRAFT_999512 [Mucidula mucida]